MVKVVAFFAQFAKFVTAASGAVAVAISLGLLSGDPQKWVTGGLAVATAFLVYFVPNKTAT